MFSINVQMSLALWLTANAFRYFLKKLKEVKESSEITKSKKVLVSHTSLGRVICGNWDVYVVAGGFFITAHCFSFI